ncbi:hypothetical protein CB0940_02177 [Cercospora beticola]|uniref:Uncharacterized protein n=1 Tax=Cercospora beticola TaxID=122368 RepID=A0A2G5IAU0_CERBT|nr:hypothetical protein CB0940_02177 [Cercospora beticola]PIB01918.1 hypothetical protein CB0940_02177 [Cercospora beticola]
MCAAYRSKPFALAIAMSCNCLSLEHHTTQTIRPTCPTPISTQSDKHVSNNFNNPKAVVAVVPPQAATQKRTPKNVPQPNRNNQSSHKSSNLSLPIASTGFEWSTHSAPKMWRIDLLCLRGVDN